MEDLPVLKARSLEIRYRSNVGVGPVDLTVYDNEILGVVGESGSGKTTLGMGILGGLPRSATITNGTIEFLGRDLAAMNSAEWREVRWKKLAYVPQGAMNVLNPVSRVRAQFRDTIDDHSKDLPSCDWTEAVARVLDAVRLPQRVLDQYPHELSGGMKQRVCIALAILFDPRLIVADESTSALDVVSQRVVLQTLMRLRSKTSIMLIGHDMALQAQVADRIAILSAGQIVEIAPARAIFSNPQHVYTQRLIASVPSILKKTGIPDLPAPVEVDRKAWLAKGSQLVEVSPGHLVREPFTAGSAK